MKKVEAGDICENGDCTHDATALWIGDGGFLAMSRSYMQAKWCDCCMTRAQLTHAEEAAKRVEELRQKLKTACS